MASRVHLTAANSAANARAFITGPMQYSYGGRSVYFVHWGAGHIDFPNRLSGAVEPHLAKVRAEGVTHLAREVYKADGPRATVKIADGVLSVTWDIPDNYAVEADEAVRLESCTLWVQDKPRDSVKHPVVNSYSPAGTIC